VTRGALAEFPRTEPAPVGSSELARVRAGGTIIATVWNRRRGDHEHRRARFARHALALLAWLEAKRRALDEIATRASDWIDLRCDTKTKESVLCGS
jgi:hypothetical protein